MPNTIRSGEERDDGSGVQSSRPIEFIPPFTDAERAADLRNKLRPILEQACEIITAARRDGLIISFNLSPDQYGVTRVMALDVVKPL